jgi:hypothetical protein
MIGEARGGVSGTMVIFTWGIGQVMGFKGKGSQCRRAAPSMMGCGRRGGRWARG